MIMAIQHAHLDFFKHYDLIIKIQFYIDPLFELS